MMTKPIMQPRKVEDCNGTANILTTDFEIMSKANATKMKRANETCFRLKKSHLYMFGGVGIFLFSWIILAWTNTITKIEIHVITIDDMKLR